MQKYQNDKNMLQTKRKINKIIKKDRPETAQLVLIQVNKGNLQSTSRVRLVLFQTNPGCKLKVESKMYVQSTKLAMCASKLALRVF